MRITTHASLQRTLLLIAAIALWLLPSTAGAVVEGPCTGKVEIDGITYTPENDSPDNPIVIPDRSGLIAEWSGSTTTGPITNHVGEVSLVVGPTAFVIDDWDGENAEEETSSRGNYAIDDAKDILPFDVVGLYELQAFHSGDEARCDGSAMVLVEGNPLSTPLGLGAAAGTLIAAAGITLAGRGRNA